MNGYKLLAIAILERVRKDIVEMRLKGTTHPAYHTIMGEVAELVRTQYFEDLCNIAEVDYSITYNNIVKELDSEYRKKVEANS